MIQPEILHGNDCEGIKQEISPRTRMEGGKTRILWGPGWREGIVGPLECPENERWFNFGDAYRGVY
jgi:hypothetical protein